MAALVVRPPLVTAALLFGLSLLGSHEPAPREPGREIRKPALVIQLDQPPLPPPPRPSRDAVLVLDVADMQTYPRGMVIRPPETGDRLDVWVAADWLSGFLTWLASRPA